MKIDPHKYRKLEKKIIKYISKLMSTYKESLIKRFEIHTSKRINGYTRITKTNCNEEEFSFIKSITDFIKENCPNDEIQYDIRFFKAVHNSNGVMLTLTTDYSYNPEDLQTYLRMKGISL